MCYGKYWRRPSLLGNVLKRKSAHTLKIVLFELPYNKNIGKLFPKYEPFFPSQTNSSSDPSQILILQHPIPISSLPPSQSLSNFALENWKHSSTILIIVFFDFLISSYPIQPHATSIEYTKAMPSQSYFLLEVR